MSGEMVSFAKAFFAHGALELILVTATFVWVDYGTVVIFVMRSHVVNEIGGHTEVHITLGAYVLRWQAQCG